MNNRLSNKYGKPTIKFGTPQRPFTADQHAELAEQLFIESIKDDMSGENSEDRARWACEEAERRLRTQNN